MWLWWNYNQNETFPLNVCTHTVLKETVSQNILSHWNCDVTRTNWPGKVRELILDSDSRSQGVMEYAFRVLGSRGIGLNIWRTLGTTFFWDAILSGEATGNLNRNHHRSMGGWLDSVCLLMPAASTVLTHQHHQIISIAINVIISV